MYHNKPPKEEAMLKTSASRIAIFITIAVFVVGCSGIQIKTPDQMTAKERGAFTMMLYNNAFSNYNAQFAATPKPMGADMVNYFQGYKKVMEASWPVISAYISLVNIGGTPTAEQEAQIVQLIYQLQAILIAKIG
jgi:hypothetical protein